MEQLRPDGAASPAVAGIVLAAGLSSRMGGVCKLVLPVAGVPLLVHGIRSLTPWCGRVVVVTGAHEETIGLALQACPTCERVHNPRVAGTMISSVKEGLRHLLGGPADVPVPARIFILPGDCAFVDPSVCGALLATDADVAMPAYRGQTGHPVLLSGAAARAVMHASDGTPLCQCLAACHTVRVDVEDPGILIYVDTREAYGRILRNLDRRFRGPFVSFHPPGAHAGKPAGGSHGSDQPLCHPDGFQ